MAEALFPFITYAPSVKGKVIGYALYSSPAAYLPMLCFFDGSGIYGRPASEPCWEFNESFANQHGYGIQV